MGFGACACARAQSKRRRNLKRRARRRESSASVRARVRRSPRRSTRPPRDTRAAAAVRAAPPAFEQPCKRVRVCVETLAATRQNCESVARCSVQIVWRSAEGNTRNDSRMNIRVSSAPCTGELASSSHTKRSPGSPAGATRGISTGTRVATWRCGAAKDAGCDDCGSGC